MKTKIYILLSILYIASFYRAFDDYIASFDKIGSYVNLLIDLTIIVIGCLSLGGSSKRSMLFFVLFLLISTFTYLLGDYEIVGHLNGLREVLDIFCLMMFFDSVVNEGYLDYFNHYFVKFVYGFLIIQIPLSVLQFLKYTAGDHVGGSFGVMGGSGVLSLLLFLLIYYLIENKGTDRPLIKKTMHLGALFVFLLPIFINETKVSFILIPLLVLTFVRLKQILSSFLLIAVAAFFLLFFGSQYSDQGKSYNNAFTEIFDEGFLEDYLSGDVVNYEDVPRFTKLQLGTALLAKDNSKMAFGVEYGAFKGGTSVETSVFRKQYGWLLAGTVPYLFYILMSGGISLLVLLLISIFSTISSRPLDGGANYSGGLLLFIAIVFLMMLFYNDAFRNQSFLICFMYLLCFSKNFRTAINEDI